MNDISRGKIAVKGFADSEMDFQLIRQMGASRYQGASVGECLAIASAMETANPERWVQAFEELGEWQQRDGMERLEKDHIISAQEQLFKACNSFRAAEYYMPCQSEKHRQLGLKSSACFEMAMAVMDCHFETHQIPYKNVHIPAYFISPANDGKPRRTLMIVSGFDGTLEEEFIMRGRAGLERGYNVIHFAGPGQMDVFRHYPETFFEPDFEGVLKAVINHFDFRQEVDMQHLSLYGISFGGYFAVRAAAHEPRVKALIANSPVLDLKAYLQAFVGMDPALIPDEEDFGLDDLVNFSEQEFPASAKAQTEQLLIRFGQSSFKKTFEYLKDFQVGEALSQYKGKTLAMIGSGEGAEPRRQYQQFIELTHADHYEFTDFEGASSHCQVGNVSFANAVVYDWLDSL